MITRKLYNTLTEKLGEEATDELIPLLDDKSGLLNQKDKEELVDRFERMRMELIDRIDRVRSDLEKSMRTQLYWILGFFAGMIGLLVTVLSKLNEVLARLPH